MEKKTLVRLARKHGTPLYVYDEQRIRENLRRYSSAFTKRYSNSKIFYAYKANTNLAVCNILRQEGAGADTVSVGELKTALKVGLKPSQIIYTSNSKSASDLDAAVKSNVIINVGSQSELKVLEGVSAKLRKTAKISFRINPSVNPKTNPKIVTGLKNTKFGLHVEKGMALQAYLAAKRMKNVRVVGVQTHIGSQILQTEAFEDATDRLMQFSKKLADNNILLDFIDLGGGLGIPYEGGKGMTPDRLAAKIIPRFKKGVKNLGYAPELWLEPGRYIVGDAGVLLTSVNSVKKTPYKRFVNVDCGFNTLMRPAMYGSYHRVEKITGKGVKVSYDIAGNVCESGDMLATNRQLPKVAEGDILIIYDAGAYGFSMASEYNSQPLPAEILVSGKRHEVIRERGRIEDLYRRQKIPKHLKR